MTNKSANSRSAIRIIKVVAVIGFCLCPSLVVAQLKFNWPTSVPQPERYVSVEHCTAGLNRILNRAIIEQNKSIRIDTMPLHFDSRTLMAQPDALVQFATDCSNKYDVKSFVLKEGWELLAKINRLADRSNQFKELIDRRLDIALKADSIEYAGVLDTIVMILQSLNPSDLNEADSLLDIRLLLPDTAPAKALAIYLNYNQMQIARTAGRLELAEAAAKRVIDISEKLTSADRSTKEFASIRKDILRAYSFADWIRSTDLLSRNVKSYLDIRLKQWESVTGNTVQLDRFAIGKVAIPIPADEIFQGPSSSIVAQNTSVNVDFYPIPNALNLVVFLGHECYRGGTAIGLPFGKAYGRTCPRTISVLQRFHRRFPELRIVVAVETHGYFSFLGPLKPEEESQWLRKWIHEFMDTPADLVVTYIPHFFLPGSDGRRVEETLDHVTFYSFGRKHERTGRDWVIPQTAFLVNRDGLILHTDRLVAGAYMFSEQEFSDLIEATLSSYKNVEAGTHIAAEAKDSLLPVHSTPVSEITDTTIRELTRILNQLSAAIGDNIERRQLVSSRLYSWMISLSSRLPGEKELEQFDDLPEIKKVMEEGFKNGAEEILRSIVRIFTALNYVSLEKDGEVNEAKSQAARSSIKISESEYEVVRRHYDNLSNALSFLTGTRRK